MASLILVDTDILIDAGRKVAEAVDSLVYMERQATLGVSMITQMELIVGCRNKRELRILERFLVGLELSLLRRYRLSYGLLIADAFIAATAFTVDCPLVTKNQRDYRFIEALELLPYPQALT